MTEHEKDFFCMGLKISLNNDGEIDDFPCCDNHKFKYLYLTYYRDFTGGSSYQKLKGLSLYSVEPKEVQRDLKYLHSKSEEWKDIIQKTNHKNLLLQETCTETRNELKQLSEIQEVKSGYWRKGSHLYKYKEMAILLHSKFIYCTALEVFEEQSPDDMTMKINGLTIEFTEYSLLHVLNRHYAAIIKPYNTGKSFHNMNFKPRLLNRQIKDIIHEIDTSKKLASFPIDKIGFEYKKTTYLIWISERTKSIKGKGNVKYYRIDTFYPVTDLPELSKLTSKCDLVKLSNDLSVFVPNGS